MNTLSLRHLMLGALVTGASLLTGTAVAGPDHGVTSGRAAVYKQLEPESLERPSTAQQIKGLDPSIAAPTQIWTILEAGERTECLDCIPIVEKFVWNPDARVREISAWWLRRRVFGVFGPGQAYQRITETLGNASEPETRRAYAASALGEFLTHTGVAPLSAAVRSDPSPMVRLYAVRALQRMSSQGQNQEIAFAMADQDESVRGAALFASIRINGFTGVAAVAARVSDASPLVRLRAAEVLGTMKVGDATASLIALTSPATEQDVEVRRAAVTALGKIGDAAGQDAVRAAGQDPDRFVRDAAAIAARRLGIGL